VSQKNLGYGAPLRCLSRVPDIYGLVS